MPTTGNSVLLDTSIVVRHFRDPLTVASQLTSFGELFLPVIALAELYCGAFRSARPEVHIAKIQRFLAAVELLLPDDETAEQYGRIASQLAAAGTPIPQNDVWIAALGVQHGVPVWSEDGHFERVGGLTLVKS